MKSLSGVCLTLACCLGFAAADASAQVIAGTYVGTYSGAESGTVTITIDSDNHTVKCDFAGDTFDGSAISDSVSPFFSIGCLEVVPDNAWSVAGVAGVGAGSLQGAWGHDTFSGYRQGTWSATLSSGSGSFTTIGPGITGSWFNVSQSGHGFALEVLPGSPTQLLAYWFVFGPAGGPAWIVASGPVDGKLAVLTASQVAGSGGLFPPQFDASNVAEVPWGTMTFTFSDCMHGHVHWDSTASGYGSGELDIQRLTLPAGLACP